MTRHPESHKSLLRSYGAVPVGLIVGMALLALQAGIAIPANVQDAAAAPDLVREGTYLYRFAMLQAGPGRLVELIKTLRKQAPVVVSAGDELPIVVQHSQGDHWDLLVIYPMGSYGSYYAADRLSKRAATVAAQPIGSFQALRPLLSWHEDLFVLGPPIEALREHVRDKGLLHFEMLQALPGKFEALVEERRMENRYNRERGRGQTLIFVHDQGAAWDVVTLGVYRDWHEYADSSKIPKEVSELAARKAGFADAGSVGAFMRTLISTHRDTLGPPIPLNR